MYYRLQQNFFHFETLVLFALSPESLGGGVRGSGWVAGGEKWCYEHAEAW